MLIQTTLTPTTQSLAHPMSARVSMPAAALFAGCPELLGVDFSYWRDEEIYGEGEPAKSVYKVVSGAVRTYKLLSDGRRQIGALHFPGDLFGSEPGEAHRLTAEAVADARVLVFKRRRLETLAARDVGVAHQLWTRTAQALIPNPVECIRSPVSPSRRATS